jgi:UDP-N-acetylmuramyl pentapeptide phosphotransferase/UDP-N-acetylglucosamine-1-phosphate transferase
VVIIPVSEIVFVIEQRLLLKEEVRILRQRREMQHETEVVLRNGFSPSSAGQWARRNGGRAFRISSVTAETAHPRLHFSQDH